MAIQQFTKFGFAGALVGFLLVATGYCDARETSSEQTNGESAEYDKGAIIKEIDAAIERAVEPQNEAVLKKIRKCVEDGGTELTLWRSRPTKLPPVIWKLTKLTKLKLDWNELSKLPPGIGALTKLTSLNLRANQLTTLPPEIGKLTNLRELYLNSNKLRSLPPEIGKLTNGR